MLERAKALAAEVKEAEEAERAADAALREAHLTIPNVVDDEVPARRRGRRGDAAHRRRGARLRLPGRATTSRSARRSARSTSSAAPRSPARASTSSPASARSSSSPWSSSRSAAAVAAGFTPVIAPALVKPEAMEGTGFLGAHDEEVYRVERDDLYLVGTSEVALAGMHAKEVLDLSAGPLRYAGWSSCFRREAGSYGKDTRGIIRVHWFDKVEMFSFCRPEETRGRAPAAAAVGGGVPPGARAALPGRRHRRRRPRHQRRPQVRHRGVVPHPGHLPRADVARRTARRSRPGG